VAAGQPPNLLINNAGNTVHEIDPNSPTWAIEVSDRLATMAVPIFNRQQPLNAGLATLCLGVEADENCEEWIGDGYREVAAGVTLMEMRGEGEAPVTETIMLAVG
jgi:hypothetical protein